MYDLSNPNTVKRILSENGFAFKKQLGQNFLIDGTVCPRMAEAAVTEKHNVLEIGPGIGVLTAELAKAAKKVVAVEIDRALQPVLAKTLAPYPNAKVVWGDVLKLDLPKLFAEEFDDDPIAICANLPYYVTSPILMHLLESRLPVESITVMVQKEAAERLCADISSREAGAISVAVSYYASPEILFYVDRDSFMPPPNVDSAVIRLDIRSVPPVQVPDEAAFFKLVKAAFAQRRKTFVNSVSSAMGVEKDLLRRALEQIGQTETVRAERLTLEELAQICTYLYNEKK